MDAFILAQGRASHGNSNDDGAVIVVFLVLGLFLVFMYFLPTAIAILRRPIGMGTAIVINVFLGWTLVGWVTALALAFGARRVRVQVDHRYHGVPFQAPPAYWIPPADHQARPPTNRI